MFKSPMFHHLDNFYSTKLAMFGLIQIHVYALYWFTIEPIYKQKINIFHLCNLRQHIVNMFFVDPYMQMIPNWS